MKCTLLLIKLLIFVLAISILSACASSSKKHQSRQGMTSSVLDKIGFSKTASAVNVNERDKKKYKLALIYLQDGELLLADKALLDISRKYPTMAGPIINRGIIAMKEGRWEAAETLFSNAQTYSPSNPSVFNYLGVTYRQQGKFSDAKAVYLQAIDQDEKFASAYLNLGILFDMYLSDYEMAKKYYLEYQALVPGDLKVKTWLIDIDQRLQASN